MCANTTAKYNMSIIVLYMIFIVSFLYDKHYDIIGILTSIAFAVLFPLSIRKEPKQTDGKRFKVSAICLYLYDRISLRFENN